MNRRQPIFICRGDRPIRPRLTAAYSQTLHDQQGQRSVVESDHFYLVLAHQRRVSAGWKSAFRYQGARLDEGGNCQKVTAFEPIESFQLALFDRCSYLKEKP